jgi:hypothetical protein
VNKQFWKIIDAAIARGEWEGLSPTWRILTEAYRSHYAAAKKRGRASLRCSAPLPHSLKVEVADRPVIAAAVEAAALESAVRSRMDIRHCGRASLRVLCSHARAARRA